MADGVDGGDLERGEAALQSGRWAEARTIFESVLTTDDSAEANLGLAGALWWLGENRGSVDACVRAYGRFVHRGDIASAVRCAAWLGIVYKANFANFAAANGWLTRAERLVEASEPSLLHAWIWLARAYQNPDLSAASLLTERALQLARSDGDVDAELVALSQLGRIKVGLGDTDSGLAMIDEAMAAALSGEGTNLDTVVYVCCDMLNACELAVDLQRAAQWCDVADDFVETYGCPFLYAECRLLYGGVLVAKGRWRAAEEALAAALRVTAQNCPGLHTRALSRLVGLRLRQGRLEEAERLLAILDDQLEGDEEAGLVRATLRLAQGDGAGAARLLEQRLELLSGHQIMLGTGLGLLVRAWLAAEDTAAAESAAVRLERLAEATDEPRAVARALTARGLVAAATGDRDTASQALDSALAAWTDLGLPYERAEVHVALAMIIAGDRQDLAVEHARRAQAAYQQLGATLDADRVAAFLRTLGVPSRTGSRSIGPLTPRERDVLGLLGEGLTNPEIAARLFVSRKTVAHHVSSILTKLQVRNRAEAAVHGRLIGLEIGQLTDTPEAADGHAGGHDRDLPDSARSGRGVRGEVRSGTVWAVGSAPRRRSGR
jgi:ATP/maltotriose-dependent transcriptional regulator MalT